VARNSSSPAAAVRFLEYLSGDAAQAHFANGNSEYPVVRSVHAEQPGSRRDGQLQVRGDPDFRGRSEFGEGQVMLDRVSYK
jgi:iron(III) transport system substrate-binding protein